jgi:hypothetical protein
MMKKEKKIQATSTALGRGYRVDGLQVRGYGYIKVGSTAKARLGEDGSEDA